MLRVFRAGVGLPWLLTLAAAAPVAPAVARAEVYLSEEQAVKALFPSGTFTRKLLQLTPAEVAKVEAASGETVRNPGLVAWVDAQKNVVYIDQVLGKHELITYAVAVKADGHVQGIEIMEYRETYGDEVRKPAWRRQFAGKDKLAPLKVGKDIVNISGGTLSSVHVTNGVRRMLQTHDVVHARL